MQTRGGGGVEEFQGGSFGLLSQRDPAEPRLDFPQSLLHLTVDQL
jgi:hypothetical protein